MPQTVKTSSTDKDLEAGSSDRRQIKEKTPTKGPHAKSKKEGINKAAFRQACKDWDHVT